MWGLCRTLFSGLVPNFEAVLHHTVQYLCMCEHVQYIHCSQCVFFTSLGRCVSFERWWKEKALFRRTYQSPAFSPGLFVFLWFDLFVHVLVHVFTLVFFDFCYSKVLSSFWWYKVLVPAVAGLIGWTLQHRRLILGLSCDQLHCTLLIHH